MIISLTAGWPTTFRHNCVARSSTFSSAGFFDLPDGCTVFISGLPPFYPVYRRPPRNLAHISVYEPSKAPVSHMNLRCRMNGLHQQYGWKRAHLHKGCERVPSHRTFL